MRSQGKRRGRDDNLEVCVTIYVSGLDQSRGDTEEEPGKEERDRLELIKIELAGLGDRLKERNDE